MTSTWTARVAGAGLAALLAVAVVPAAAGADGDRGGTGGQGVGEVVASGLDNPRGLAWSNGRLLIAESGVGGNGSCVPGIFAPEICLGRTGAVTEVDRRGRQRRIVDRLPSLAGPDGTFAYGPSDVSTYGGAVYVSIGGPNEAEYREDLLTERIAQKLGTAQLLVGPLAVTVADVSAYVLEHDPDGGALRETNTNSVLAGRRGLFVVDSGGNTLYEVGWWGNLVVRHVFDDVVLPDGTSIDDVPTNMAFGPDGALYVSTLTGVPFPDGAATVWRWDGQQMTTYADGLTALTDLAFGPDGSLYVVEMRSVLGEPGRVVRIAPDGSREVVVDGLDFPTGVAIGDGMLYVTNHGTSPDAGTVQRYRI